MRRCPFCAEEIQNAAVVCKHCGRELTSGASQVPVSPKKRKGCASTGCLAIIITIVILWAIALLMPNAPTAPPTRAVDTPPPAVTDKPENKTPVITEDDLKREKKGRFGRHVVSALEKDGQWILTFDPALPRSDKAVIDALEYALREFLRIDTHRTEWRPLGRFLRVVAGPHIYDVLLIKNDDGTIHSASLVKR